MEGHIGKGDIKRRSEPVSQSTQRPFPWLISSLVILNWAAFLYSLYRNNCPSKSPHDRCLLYGSLGRLSFQPLDQNPQLGPAGSTLVNLGALKWNLKGKETRKWLILLSLWLHGGLVDLILDTISLFYMGMELETKYGTVKIGSLYFLSSIGGSLWASVRFRGATYVGGSSGVCGLTGGAIAELFVNFYMHEEKFKRFRSLCVGVAINFAIKIFPMADVSGNIGGLYMGFLLGFLLLIRRQPEVAYCEYKHLGLDQQFLLKYSPFQRVVWIIALIALFIQFLYSLIRYILH